MNKKTIFILGIVIVLAVVGVFLYLERPAEVIENQEVVEDPERPAEVIENQEVIENNEVVKEPEEPIVPIDRVPGLSSCIMLDEEHCGKAKLIYYPEEETIPIEKLGTLFSIGFNLPEGTRIYAPFDGLITTMGGGKSPVSPFRERPYSVRIAKYPIEFENIIKIFFNNAKIDPIIDSRKETTIEGGKHHDYIGIKVKQGELIGTIKDGNFAMARAGQEAHNFAISAIEMYMPTLIVPDVPLEELSKLWPSVHISEILKEYFRHLK